MIGILLNNRYQIEAQLGEGGAGKVSAARRRNSRLSSQPPSRGHGGAASRFRMFRRPWKTRLNG